MASLMWATDILEFWQFCYEVFLFIIFGCPCEQQIFQYLTIFLKKKNCVRRKRGPQNFKISLRARVRRLLLFWCFFYDWKHLWAPTHISHSNVFLSMFVCLFALQIFWIFWRYLFSVWATAYDRLRSLAPAAHIDTS